jgi:uncharacterized membrane-anchored protein YitT (DUF2179 family)
MSFIQKEVPFSNKWFVSWSLIILGAFILALGFVLFIIPYNFVPGGIYGLGIVAHYLSGGLVDFWPQGIPIGLFSLLLNIPLTLLGIKLLGPRFGVKTIIGFFLASAFMDLLTLFIGTNDPLGLGDDLLLAGIFGGVLLGVGFGLIFKSKATSGGSDIIAMIIGKYTKWPLGQLLIYIDSTIVLIGLLVFKDWKIPLYSWLIIYISGKIIDTIIEGVSYEKMVLIVSDKHVEIRNVIVDDLNRGGTFLLGEGLFKNEPKKMIYTIINRRELAMLEDYINKIDPKAFLTVVNAKEILGSGFRSLNDKLAE